MSCMRSPMGLCMGRTPSTRPACGRGSHAVDGRRAQHPAMAWPPPALDAYLAGRGHEASAAPVLRPRGGIVGRVWQSCAGAWYRYSWYCDSSTHINNKT